MTLESWLTGVDPGEYDNYQAELNRLGRTAGTGYDQYAHTLQHLGEQYDPYIKGGQSSLNDLMGQYHNLIHDPNALQNQLAGGYEESPYAKYQTKVITQALNNQAAATGMLGSGSSRASLADHIHGILSGDMNTYINRGMGSYGMGLSGEQGLNQLGYDALGRQTNLGQMGAQGTLQGILSRIGYGQQGAQAHLQGQNLSNQAWTQFLGHAAGIAGKAFGVPGMGGGGIPGMEGGDPSSFGSQGFGHSAGDFYG